MAAFSFAPSASIETLCVFLRFEIIIVDLKVFKRLKVLHTEFETKPVSCNEYQKNAERFGLPSVVRGLKTALGQFARQRAVVSPSLRLGLAFSFCPFPFSLFTFHISRFPFPASRYMIGDVRFVAIRPLFYRPVLPPLFLPPLFYRPVCHTLLIHWAHELFSISEIP